MNANKYFLNVSAAVLGCCMGTIFFEIFIDSRDGLSLLLRLGLSVIITVQLVALMYAGKQTEDI